MPWKLIEPVNAKTHGFRQHLNLGNGCRAYVDSGQTKHCCQVRWLLLANSGTNRDLFHGRADRSGRSARFLSEGSNTLGAGIGGVARVAERVLCRKLLSRDSPLTLYPRRVQDYRMPAVKPPE